jgi:elongation factor 1-beta
MAQVVVTIIVNPESPEVDLEKLEAASAREINAFGGRMHKTEQEPIGFGLKAIKLMFTMDESKGGTDSLEQKLASLPGVASARVTDVRRTIG